MNKYAVSVPYVVWVTVEVKAINTEDAIEQGIEESYITGYCGNGGTDKLIGVNGVNRSIEAGDEVAEGVFTLAPVADLID